MKRIALFMLLAVLCIMEGRAGRRDSKPDGDGAFFPSYWRNDKTGTWDIAFLADCVIWDCKVWEYTTTPDTAAPVGKTSFTLRNGDKEITVKVGKERNGRRDMAIGKCRGLYAPINGSTLPDYPAEEACRNFADNDYRPDTVVLSGWLRNMPEDKKGTNTLTIMTQNDLTLKADKQGVYIDAQGRFTAKVPVMNTTEVVCMWGMNFIRTVVEPGRTYFLLYDYSDNRHYVMGDDARVQNELLRFPAPLQYLDMEPGENFDSFMEATDKLISRQRDMADSLYAAHPGLSARFRTYYGDKVRWQQARAFGQARFNLPDKRLPDNARQYAYDTFWTRMPEPRTLHGEVSWFCCDFVQDTYWRKTLTADSPEKLEMEILRRYDSILDSLGTDDYVRSTFLSRVLCESAERSQMALPQSVMEEAGRRISNPAAMERLERMNGKYAALAKKDFNRLALKPSSDVEGISSGKAILDKILEPFRGKLVILDVWGTWCGPCCKALAHSAEEYRRLEPYNVAYVYLANNSQREGWENFIKENNVTGDNVAHYNLPRGQQEAVERYLEVTAFPTYRLFDKEGRMLDFSIDARDLDSLEKLIRELDI